MITSTLCLSLSLRDSPLDGDGEGDVERGGEGDVHEGEDALRPQVHVHRRRPRYDTETLQFNFQSISQTEVSLSYTGLMLGSVNSAGLLVGTTTRKM